MQIKEKTLLTTVARSVEALVFHFHTSVDWYKKRLILPVGDIWAFWKSIEFTFGLNGVVKEVFCLKKLKRARQLFVFDRTVDLSRSRKSKKILHTHSIVHWSEENVIQKLLGTRTVYKTIVLLYFSLRKNWTYNLSFMLGITRYCFVKNVLYDV